MANQSKAELLRSLVVQGEKKGALAIAASFSWGLSPDQKKAIKTGHECHNFADFYKQCGVDPEAAIEKAWETLINLPVVRGQTV